MAGILIVDQIQNSSNTLLINSGALAGNTVGTAQLQSGITVAANTITANTVTTSGMSLGGVSIGAGDASIMKNRIINGAMVIDQRNAGASVTQSTSTQFVTDRFAIYGNVASKFTAQQSSTAPAGFTNSLLITSSSAYTVGAAERFQFRQAIEGFNIADLNWGTANAKTVTLSFWVQSSLTGNFGGALGNNAGDRSYPFSYTISSANTWTQVSITIAGDTTGTWLTNNSGGIWVYWGLGMGSTFSGTAGAWASATYYTSTGATSVVGTSGATFYITGVQLEVGSSATGFEYRQYGQELALCQRYFQVINGAVYRAYLTGLVFYWIPWQVTCRAAPTITNTSATYSSSSSAVWYNASINGAEISFSSTGTGSSYYAILTTTISAEL